MICNGKYLPAVLLALLALPASADVYKCTDDAGHVTYTNQKPAPKGCKLLSVDQTVNSVPAPRGSARSSSGFPKVDGDTQKARDTDRRRILDGELASEQKSLEEARQALSEGESQRLGDERNYQKYQDRVQRLKDEVAVHERNVQALQREISNLPQ
ncbi:MAG: DUF4124 domain-containing protein [Rhodocyclaceae bacterium]|nr:DUF4124 domain-containing protein [Rhodocyclaceae bacterium]MBX3667899.1 DUF4124 domain-containing protein [Rhodocyclaceae bacterium]